MRRRKWLRILGLLLAMGLVAVACGDSDDDGDGGDEGTGTASASATEPAEETDDTEAPDETDAGGEDESPDETDAPETTLDEAAAAGTLDANGDGEVVFGIAAAGPRDDGAYYEAVVDAAVQISADNGFGEPIVVDNIQSADAATELDNLAQQGVDVIIVGASEIAEPLPDLTEQYADIFWYCNCGAGFPELPGLAQSLDDGAEVAYTAGYATGLLLQDAGGESAVMIGCCELGFEKEFELAFALGLSAVDESFALSYVPSGDFPFDFDNVANATEALNNAVADGADAVLPYLGGAHRPIVQAAAEQGLVTMSAGASNVCDADEELDYSIAVRFDGGDYVTAVMGDIVAGDFTEGQIRTFRVGVDEEPGAVICDATPEQQEAMDAVYAEIASGALAEDFGAIKGEAYAG